VVDRRGLLLAGAAGALLSGCGGGSARTATLTPTPTVDDATYTRTEGDVEVLNGLLDLEHVFAALYVAHRGATRGAGRALYDTLIEHERDHVRRLIGAVRDLGGRPAAPAAPSSAAGDPFALAERVERTAVAAYVDAVPKVADPDLRRLLATIVAVEAEHLAAARLQQGAVAVPVAFVAGARVL
jgi:hypothetical protein